MVILWYPMQAGAGKSLIWGISTSDGATLRQSRLEESSERFQVDSVDSLMCFGWRLQDCDMASRDLLTIINFRTICMRLA